MFITMFGFLRADGEPEELAVFAGRCFSELKRASEALQRQNDGEEELSRLIDEALRHQNGGKNEP